MSKSAKIDAKLMRKVMKKDYPLLHDKKLLKKLGEAATLPLQIFGSYEDQVKFQAMVTPGVFLELLDYWFQNDGKKFDYRGRR